MKHLKLISILSIVFALSTATAGETKVGGEIWADFDVVLDNGNGTATTNDAITPMGMEVRRARVSVEHTISDVWSATLKLDSATATSVVRGYLTGKNWVAEGTTIKLGLQKNAYKGAYDKHHHMWLHRDLTSEFSSILAAASAYDLAATGNLNDFAGVNLNWMINDMWNVSFTVNNGPNALVQNNGSGGASSDINGYGLTVEGKFNDNFGMLLGYDTYGSYKSGTDDSGADNVNGFTATRVTFFYASEMIDASLEYAMWDQSIASGTDLESTSALALSLDYKMDKNFVHVYYAMTQDFEKAVTSPAADDVEIDNGLESKYSVGYVWGLEDNLHTGVFYTAKTRDDDSSPQLDKDESLIEWKWAATF